MPQCEVLNDPGGPPLAPAPPKMDYSGIPEIVQISDLNKRALWLQNGPPSGSHWRPQISNFAQKCLPKALSGPLPKTVSKYVAFLTLQTLENQAPAWAGAQFSLCGPTPKKSSKRSPKTSLWGSPWPLKRSQCGKIGHLEIHSKIHPEKYQKMPNMDSQMCDFFGVKWVLEGSPVPGPRPTSPKGAPDP